MRKTKYIIFFLTIIFIFSNTSSVLSYNLKKVEIYEHNSWAVFISLGDTQSDYNNLRDFKNILKDNGWLEENIFTLYQEHATRDNILSLPQMLSDEGLKEDDLLLIYFSTHGFGMEDEEPYDEPDGLDEFIITHIVEGESRNGISDDELSSSFDNINCDNFILIFETCNSGGMLDGSSDLKKTGRIILTSTDYDETSFGLFLKQSWLFPFYLIKALSGKGDINDDKYITVEEAFNYAKKRTIIRSFFYGLLLFVFHRSIFIQHPQIYDAWPSENDNIEDLILIRL